MGQLRELSYDAEDCIDKYTHNLSHGDTSDGLTHKLTGLVATLKARRRIGNQIKELMERAIKVSDRHKRYEQSPSMSCPNSVVIDPRLHAVFEEADRLVGIDKQRDKLVTWLTDCIDLHPHRMVVSIVGPGGLGKTTLANQVFQKITSQFDCTAFVSVSRSPNVNKILSDAFLQVLESNCKKTAEQSEDIARIQDLGHGGLHYLQLISRMRCYLQNKRYFVIIDDIWSTQAWKDIQCAFPQDKNASRIMTTTRIHGVAESCSFPNSIYVYPMKPLDNDDSKRLFMKRTFGHEDDCPLELQEITDDILRKCDGLPLAIVNIASLLATKQPSKKEWEGVHKSIGSTLEQDQELGVVKGILFLSYYDLPYYLKICLLDLSIFPGDHQIDRLRLIRRWMAEGLIIEQQGRSLEDTGESYISELINKNMIQPVGIDYSGRPRACRVHGIMLDLIVSLSTKENFATILDNQKLTHSAYKIRRLSIHGNCEERKLCQGTDGLRHTRSLSVFGDAKKIPSLLDFQVLRVLDLENFTNLVDGDIGDIGCLIHLRYLSFSNISKIPKQIGKLQNLQTLDLKWTTIRELPGTVVQLRQLVRLFLPYGVELPHGIDSLVALQELSRFCVARNSPEVLVELGNLTTLKMLGIDWESNGDSSDEARSKKYLVSSLCKLGERNLQSLYISACVPCSLDFLVNSWLPPPLQLQKFSSIGDKRTCLSRLPKWIPSLSELTCLQILVEQLRIEDMQALKGLPTLLYLNLHTKECTLETLTIGSGGFERLKEFDFGAFSGGPGPIFEAGAMPRIEKLHFAFTVHDMTYAYGAGCDFGIGHLSSLKGLWVIMDCFSARARQVEAAEAAIRNAATLLPNHPIPKIYRMGERAMVKEDDE
ncbi:unnamed protein product [Urochloa decumbens]|uniref:AAA+ ATPase domain-containing protein n=1 Tax=Urochloa decumbens TaxID=240449 RepID=A0ABC9BLG9_9POAL